MNDSQFHPSLNVSSLIPSDIAQDSERFLLFLKAYYEWLQTTTITLDNVDGTFVRDEDVVGNDSGAIGTIRENIALGFPAEFATDQRINKTLKIAHLESFVDSLENKADTQVGERGAKLSGGQRQRLGIARAMFTNPKLLVLDEATSALDAETEASVSNAIQSLRGGTTILMIAHRLATVRTADLVVYIESGKILAQGTFAEVRKAVPEFDKQAKLLGL